MKCEKFYNVINQTDVPYAQIPNDLIRDQSISIEARGLLCLMLSHKSETWQYMASNLMEVSGLKTAKYRRCMTELEQAGYISRQKTREQGKFVGWDLFLSNKSGTYSDSSKNRQSVKPTIVKTTPKNTKNLKKTNLKENTVSHRNAIENLNQNQSQNRPAGRKAKILSWDPNDLYNLATRMGLSTYGLSTKELRSKIEANMDGEIK